MSVIIRDGVTLIRGLTHEVVLSLTFNQSVMWLKHGLFLQEAVVLNLGLVILGFTLALG